MTKTIENIIGERGYTVTRPKGTSMFPLIRSNKDYEICISKPVFPLKKYDVPVYVRKSGSYVMHRILDITEDGYVCCGDNQWVLEHGIKESQVVGVLTQWYHKGKHCTVNDKGYLRYVKFWCKSLKFRHFILFFCHKYMRITGTVKEVIGRKLHGKNK